MAVTEGGATGLSARNRLRIGDSLGNRLRNSWIGENWHTLFILLMIVLLAFFVRSYFVYSPSVDNGFLVSGGSDSYYHMRVIDHVTDTGHHLYLDPLLNYPLGMRNARPPLYDWSVAIVGMLLSSITGMATSSAVGYSLVLSTAVWGALTTIPVYLITRAAFGNKAGIIAAFLFALMAGHITRSVLSTADHDSMVLFLGVWSFYFMMMSLMSIKGDKWVSSWGKRKEISQDLSSYFRANQVSVIYAALSGVALAAVAMIWTGYAYLFVIILAYFLVQVFVNRFRNADSMGVVVTIGIMLSVAFLLAAPVYYQMNYWNTWFDVPVLLFLAAMAVGVIFVVTRDYPWTLVMPSFIILAAISLLILSIFLPNIFEAIVSGQGYFVKSKLYSTISEAQAPDFSTLVFSFGVVTFWLSFAGVIWAALRIPKNINPYLIFVVVWTAVAMFMAVSASRFMFNAAPAFAMTGGWIVSLVIDKLRFDEVSKMMAGVKGNFFTVIRRAVKVRHVLGAIFLVFLILLPNSWNAVDAAIPSDLKRSYDKQVYDVLKVFGQPSGYDAINGSNWYFGAFGYSLPLPSEYWPAAWDWFKDRDSDVRPVVLRPAFLSWWDYGFEAIQAGQHPTVADNFQNAYQYAGSFIMSQSEEDAVALFIVRVLEKTGLENESIAQAIRVHGVDYAKLRDIMENPSRYVEVVKNNPGVYGPYDSELSVENAKYAAARVQLGEAGLDNLANLYADLRQLSGVDIGYFAIDSRLFPFTATGFNIFYAPATLSDRRIDPFSKAAIDYYEIKAVDSTGMEWDLANVTADVTIVDYRIYYKEMFYDSLLYRAFLGYGPSDVGFTSQGLPGLSGSLANLPPMQAWNMSHFRMVYRTAYFNPFPEEDVSNHSDAWRAISYDEGLVLRDRIDAGEAVGTVDLSASTLFSGVVFIQYYDGAVFNGTVTTDSGQPFPGVWVTVLDEYGIPHQTVKTDSEGKFSALAPFGKVTLVYSYGDPDLRTQIATELSRKTFNVTYAQAMRERVDADGDGVWDYIFNADASLEGSDISGTVFWDLDGDGAFTNDDEVVEGAVVIAENTTNSFRQEASTVDGSYRFSGLPPQGLTLYASVDGHIFGKRSATFFPMGDRTENIGVIPSRLNGTVSTSTGEAASGLSLLLSDLTGGGSSLALTDENGHFQFARLLPGNYSLETANSSLSVGPFEFEVTEGANVTRDLVLSPSLTVSGRVFLGSTVAANVAVGLVGEEGIIWTTTDDRGRYLFTLAAGSYSAYSIAILEGTEHVAFEKVQATSGTFTLDLFLQTGSVLSGTIRDSGGGVANAEILLRSRTSGAEMSAVTSSSGEFRLVFPADIYFVYTSGLDSAHWEDLLVTSSAQVDIQLSSAVSISGQVWYDSDHNGVRDVGEGVEGIPMTLSDRDGRSVYIVTDGAGDFSMLVPSGKSFGLKLSVDGYEPFIVNFTSISSSVSENIELIPLNRSVVGTVRAGSVPVGGVAVTFEAVAGEAETASVTSASTGSFSVSLRTGQYRVIVDQNATAGSNATRYQYSADLTVAIGKDPSALDIRVTERVRVYGAVYPKRTSPTVVLFDGPERAEISVSNVSFELYLVQGNYSVYALSEVGTRSYVYLDEVDIDTLASPLNFTTVQAFDVYGRVLFEGRSYVSVAPVQITSATGGRVTVNTTSVGYFEAALPDGGYTASFNHSTTSRIDGQERFVRYVGTVNFTAPVTSQISINVAREYDNSSVSGVVRTAGGSAVSAAVDFISEGGTGMNASVSSSFGSYAVSLAPGNYSVYARQVGGMGVFLGGLEVATHRATVFNLTLQSGLRLTGSTINGELPASARISVSSDTAGAGMAVSSASDGTYEIILPAGGYNITCDSSGFENGMQVSYRLSTSVNLTTNLQRTLQLQKVIERGVDIQWDPNEKMTIEAGGTATYNLRVVNTGNVRETFRLVLELGTWTAEFSQSEVVVDFGRENSQLVTVELTAPEDAKVAHSQQKVKIYSLADTSVSDSVLLDADILPLYSLTVSYGSAYKTAGSNYSYSATIKNTGNADDSYLVSVANSEELSSLGWSVRLGAGGAFNETLTVGVAAAKTSSFDIMLVPIREMPDPSVEVIVVASSENSSVASSMLSLEPQLPDLTIPGGGVIVGGPGVYPEAEQMPLETLVLIGMCIASFLVFALIGYQRGVFRRRKR